MCHSCILINKMTPSAKTLVGDELGLDINSSHFNEIVENIVNKLPIDEQMQYLGEVATELHMKRLREK